MRAGELDRQIVIEQPNEVKGTKGELITTWLTFATLPAHFRPLRGREYFAAGQVNAQENAAFTMRWMSGITPKMRINFDGKIWDIRNIAEIGRREGLEISASVMQA